MTETANNNIVVDEGTIHLFEDRFRHQFIVSFWQNKTLVETYEYPYDDQPRSWTGARFFANVKQTDLIRKYPNAKVN